MLGFRLIVYIKEIGGCLCYLTDLAQSIMTREPTVILSRVEHGSAVATLGQTRQYQKPGASHGILRCLQHFSGYTSRAWKLLQLSKKERKKSYEICPLNW
jgi:hypothetical protein